MSVAMVAQTLLTEIPVRKDSGYLRQPCAIFNLCNMNTPHRPAGELEASIAGLYRGPLEDFVSRRDSLLKELRAAGNRDAAAAVKNLRKPSRVAWALVQAALNNSQAIDGLDSALGETLSAHTSGGDVRSATARLRSVAREFADQAMHEARQAGLNVESSVVMNAVLAVLGTPGSLNQLRGGILADIPESGSIDFLASLPTPPVVAAPVIAAKPLRAANNRRVILQEFMTLDGFVADSNDSVDFIPASMSGDDAFGQRQLRFMDSIDAILLGRKTYQMFADYWPHATSGEDKRLAEKINGTQKFVFSKTLKRAPWGDWDDAAIIPTGAGKEVARLKQEPGKNMVIWGSISLAQALVDQEVIDEFQIIVCPVVMGRGRNLFRAPIDAQELKLRTPQSFDRGAVLLTYSAENRSSVV
jgi:dihydrofolate reductase